MENINPDEAIRLYYQVDYTLTTVGDDEAYFHAQYRRSNPNKGSLHTILDGVKGKGQYVGTYMGVGTRNNGWWGEGEIKFFMDGDKETRPLLVQELKTISVDRTTSRTRRRSNMKNDKTPYAGLHQVTTGWIIHFLNSDSECIAGTFRIPFALIQISAPLIQDLYLRLRR
ncbi:MAG: DUF2961 domain-containing protein [Chryseolinea sp.]